MTNLDKKIDDTIQSVDRGTYNDPGKTPTERFGERLRRWREERGYTRGELINELVSRGISCTPSHISYWERGKKFPGPDVVDTICDILQISGAHLIGPDGPIRDAVIAVYEVSSGLSEDQLQALQTIYQRQRQREAARREEDARQQREDTRDLKKVFGV